MRSRTEPLLDDDEPAAFELINPEGASPLVLLCDHASNRIPRRLRRLGLGPRPLDSHIAWDAGAAPVAECVARLLDAPLVKSNYSRLVIDCNRPPESPQSIPSESDGIVIRGNLELESWERELRRRVLFEPYHQAIERLLDRRGPTTEALLSIHSFCPVLGGVRRPWPIGVCYGEDRRLAKAWLDALSSRVKGMVGDNEPYAIEVGIDYTLPRHGDGRGLPHAMLEIRQDLIETTSHAAAWAALLAQSWETIQSDSRRRGVRVIGDHPYRPPDRLGED